MEKRIYGEWLSQVVKVTIPAKLEKGYNWTMKEMKINEVDKEVKEAYLLEKSLARKLKDANCDERKKLYSSVYAEYYEKFPKHPFVYRNKDVIKSSTALQMNYLRDFLKPDTVFLEIGPGTGALSAEISKYVDVVYALDVSNSVLMNSHLPSNVNVVIYNGVNIPKSIKSVQIVYSSQVIEHLHPDDALEQLKNIYDILTDGGICICRTPHRFSGPHDISRNFDNISTCFHLKEYTVSELYRLFKIAGFKKVRYEIVPRGRRVPMPLFVIKSVEMMISVLPFSLKRTFTRNFPLKPLFNYCIIGIK